MAGVAAKPIGPFAPTTGRSSATANKLRMEDRAAHDWYRFVLSFPPHLVRDYLRQFEADPRTLVLDPFCGTGTTLVECKKLGIPSVGLEANPVAHMAASAKTAWDVSADELERTAHMVAQAATQEIANATKLRALRPDLEKMILTDSISPLPLHKALILIEHMRRVATRAILRKLQTALAKVLVHSISNLHFGPEVGVRGFKEDADVVGAWINEVHVIVQDLRDLSDRSATPATVHHADARDVAACLEPRSVSAVITSPPYPNEKDYTRTTRLEGVLLGLIGGKDELRKLKKSLVRSNTRGVYVDDDDHRWVEDVPEVQRIAESIERRRIELGKTSGFERQYHRVTRLYFGGMARHLADLRSVLRPGAQLAYVVGDQASYLRVMIRTGQILGQVAQRLGYELQRIDLFRTRLATATKEQLREEVVVLRWKG